MRFNAAIDAYCRDMWELGRFTSKQTEVGYRAALDRLSDECGNRDPRVVSREEVKRTLAHWRNPNSRAKNHSILRAFFDWCVEEDLTKTNPARAVRRVKKREPTVYRLTLEETKRLLGAVRGTRERRAIWLGTFLGLRSQELRGLQGRHFARPGFVWVSKDIAKGSDERWVPVVDELRPIVAEISASLEPDDYVLPAQRWRNPPLNTAKRDLTKAPMSKQALYQLVLRVGKRAGIAGRTNPHCLRRAFGDLMYGFAGMRNTQFLMGHKGISTTEGYLSAPKLDDLAAAVEGFRLGVIEPVFLPPTRTADFADKATTGLEPVPEPSHAGMGTDWLRTPLGQSVAALIEKQVPLYREALA